MRTYRDAKAMAKTLRAELVARGHGELTHSQCLEIVARQFGLDNWNILAGKLETAPAEPEPLWRTAFGAAPVVPVLRIFSEQEARRFYLDFLGFTMDFGGPSSGGGSPFYGQISRPGAALHLSGQGYVPGPGSTVDIWVTGLRAYRDLLLTRDREVFGTALGVPGIAEMHWGARVLVIPDPFGNHLRLSEPVDPAAQAHLPDWAC